VSPCITAEQLTLDGLVAPTSFVACVTAGGSGDRERVARSI